jgi:hypothetical protein
MLFPHDTKHAPSLENLRLFQYGDVTAKMENSRLKSSLTAIQKDVANYISELEQRISQLEQSAVHSESEPRHSSAFSGVSNAKKQLEEIRRASSLWLNGELEKEASDLESQLAEFTTRVIPAAIEPLSKTLEEWKSKFNTSMSATAKQYQALNQSLDVDLSELEQSAKQFASQKRTLANLSRQIGAIPLSCDALSAELQDMIDTNERELNVALAGLTQQLQIDIMRAKVTTDSTLSLSLSSAQTSSLSGFFANLQSDVNAQCAQMEEAVREVQGMLEAAEAQWTVDVDKLQEEIRGEIGLARQQRKSEVELRRKLADARTKMSELSELAQRMFPAK